MTEPNGKAAQPSHERAAIPITTMINDTANLDEVKARFPAYLDAIHHPYKIRQGVLTCCCPVHDDKHPSFDAVQKGGAWVGMCRSCGAGGTVLDIHAARNSLSIDNQFPEILEGVARIVGVNMESVCQISAEQNAGPKLPPDATAGALPNWQEVATLRKLHVIAPATAAKHLGTLRFGTACKQRCWMLTDQRGNCIEARRLDGKPFAAYEGVKERKAHCLKGSVKNWPVGLHVQGFKASDFRALLVVEGGPDYLAALHFSLHATADCLPIAFLGGGAAGTIDPQALELMRGARVRFYPHADKAGKGALAKWSEQIGTVAARMDSFSFDGLRRADGSPVKDLNDCTDIHPDDAHELEGVMP